ncbi:amino acid dehydrogenase [Pseudoxanthomonas jiangsuensis]|uniref:NAD(P)/FAD-dependent oxidoreductase n=1 Tax=Pseudoxanthomonas jiangsuensis TaxID=619688 RepID=UPI0013910508|nr:FAD-dependent oxidoreductase [Pseudoxanthomonas jiangsuensis]KAF1695206.1 amino acid dehydrogenase [Pseudoxanthomonas jiangsuensis]
MNSPHDDVLILGGGAIGLATALALLEAGRGVRVLEAATVGGATSHGNCGTITPSHAPPLAAPGVPWRALKWMLTPDAPLYLKPRIDPALWRWLLAFAGRCNARDWRTSTAGRAAILNDSRTRLKDWIGRYGLQCEFGETGLDYVFRERGNFEHYAAECGPLNELGIATEVIDGADYLRQEPALREGVVGAVRFPDDAHLRPDRYVAELARVVGERGGIVEEGCRVEALEPQADGVRVRVAGGGERRGRDAVVAMAAWTPALVRPLGLKLPIQPGKGYSITYSRPALAPRRPLVLKDRSVCVTAWGSGFRLGSTMEFSGHDTALNAVRLGALERAAREYLHEPVGATVQEKWYGWRPMTWDDLPALGRSPRHPHVWLAAGHGMLGISMSAASGQLMADLMTGRAPAIDPLPYRVERFQ